MVRTLRPGPLPFPSLGVQDAERRGVVRGGEGGQTTEENLELYRNNEKNNNTFFSLSKFIYRGFHEKSTHSYLCPQG